jgi:polar amino acid transport system substrate-binding protein
MQDGPQDKSRRRSLTLGLGGLGLAAAAVMPGEAAAQATGGDNRLDTVLKRGKLLVATFTTNPPLCFADEKGKTVGFDIDIAKMIAKGLFDDPEKIEFQEVDSSGRWPAVLSGKVDFGIASTTIYPDRAIRVAFTAPYMDSGISLMVRKDAKVSSIAELNDPRFTLANLSNPQMADRAKRFVPKAQVVTFETPSAMMLAVKTGQAQAMQMDTPVVDWYAANDPDFAVLPTPLGNLQNNAIFLKPGDFPWWLYLTTVVNEIRWGSRYDEYTAVFNKWFGRNPPPQRFYVKV